MEAAAVSYARVLFPEAVSEVRPTLSDLQRAMLNATSDCVKVVSVDGRLLTMNRAGCLALGVAEDSGFGMPWLPLLPAEVHTLGREALQKASRGYNARFPGKSLSAEGVTHWDNLLTPVANAEGKILAILCVSRDVTEKTRLSAALDDAMSREKLLSRELQHRVKNLFSVVAGLVMIAEKEAAANQAPATATSILRSKLGALSRASDVAFSAMSGAEADNDHIDFKVLANAVLLPYGDRFIATGGDAPIDRKNTTNLALFIHELATNSVKYGALGADGGRIVLEWSVAGDRLQLSWTESGGPPISEAPETQGFGSEMMDRVVRSAGGVIDRVWRPEGLVVRLGLPLGLPV